MCHVSACVRMCVCACACVILGAFFSESKGMRATVLLATCCNVIGHSLNP
jgi:hypothetical protein